jgi:hypothetical protein
LDAVVVADVYETPAGDDQRERGSLSRGCLLRPGGAGVKDANDADPAE